MHDAEIAATDAGRLARFAERVRDADRAPAGTSADRVRRLFARADLVRSWPGVRTALVAPPPTADATLAERSRQLAERCRGGRKGGLFGWPKEALELLGEAAERLVQLAERLDAARTPTGIVAHLTAAVAHLSADGHTAQLVQLDTTLAGQSDACRTFARDLAARPLGHVFEHFDAKLRPADGWTPDARAAAGVVCVILDHLTQRTSDPPVWAAVRRWAEGWFAAHGLDGGVLIDAPTPDGVIAESFPLQTSGRAVLVVVPPGGPVTVETPSADVWAALPPVPTFDGSRCPPLEEWYAVTRGGPADESRARTAFGAWLDTPAAGDWFHRWLTGVWENADSPAGMWWRVLHGKGWCEAFPDPDVKGGEFDWPQADSRASDRPFGELVEVTRFSPSPADSRVTVSDGPVSAATEAFADLFRLSADDSLWWGGGRWAEARTLGHTPTPDRVAAVAGEWLDRCQPTEAQTDAVCRWAEACGLTVVRADAADTPGVTVRHVFAAAPTGTVVGGNRAGFSTGDEVFRPAVVEVSAGPLPAGFAELERAGEALPWGCELQQLVTGLRAAAEGNYLREAVLGLYSEFWGDAGTAARDTDPDATADVGERLSSLLTDAYGLRPFFPVNVHDYPSGWIAVAAGSRVMTGVVTRVVRPGLQDDHGHLRIPAMVEVE
jgi:hypothetical protein